MEPLGGSGRRGLRRSKEVLTSGLFVSILFSLSISSVEFWTTFVDLGTHLILESLPIVSPKSVSTSAAAAGSSLTGEAAALTLVRELFSPVLFEVL